MLVEKWQFSKELTDSIRNHHSDISADNTAQSCLFVADQISKQLALGSGDDLVVEEIPLAMIERFDGGLQDIIAGLGDLSNLENEAQVINQAGKEASA